MVQWTRHTLGTNSTKGQGVVRTCLDSTGASWRLRMSGWSVGMWGEEQSKRQLGGGSEQRRPLEK